VLAPAVAYFSMEIALEPGIPTYAGGLGVLAGDTLRSAADLGLDLVAVTLVHRHGYFHQTLDAAGAQSEHDAAWKPEDMLEPTDAHVQVEIGNRHVALRAWRYRVQGAFGHEIPVYLLDANLPENTPEERAFTDRLYGGDLRYRLCQEVLLGIGGVRMLRALGHSRIDRFHLNEGHAALAVLALLDEERAAGPASDPMKALEVVRRRCVFTTHTPVPAGHDRFPADLVASVLGQPALRVLSSLGQTAELDLTELALRSVRFVNAVAMRHGEVSTRMFPRHRIRSITNGIHARTWAAPSFRALFDLHVPEWRGDPQALRHAVKIPPSEIWWAHSRAKRALLERLRQNGDTGFREDAFTIGFARRVTAYKRLALIFHDPEVLRALARKHGAIQIVFAGKAHPHDGEGKLLIQRVFEARKALADAIPIAYLPDYDMDAARSIVSGCDLWLNNPVPPLEASGTSGMKAALNGVPSLSVLDGWWIEGHVEGVTGWAIGDDRGPDGSFIAERDAHDAGLLYRKLDEAVLPWFYALRERWLETMRNAIALNASYFNTHRMVLQYLHSAYALDPLGDTRS
jgi:starch phosphorylase